MSAFDNILEAIGGIGNAAGVQGDGPSGLNAMQRASLDPAQSAQYRQQSALAQLASDPNFQAAPPADQQNAILKVTGDPAVAQKVSALSQLAKMNLSNPRAAIQQGVQSGNIAPTDALNALANPMMMTGNPQPTAQTNTTSPTPANPAVATAPKLDEEGIDQNYLNTQVPAFYRNQVMDYIKGGELPKDVSPKDKTLISNWAHNASPDFTENVAINRSKTAQDFASSGKSGQALTSAGIGTKHLAQWTLASLGLNNTAIPIIGKAVNAIDNMAADNSGEDPITTFNSTAGTVAPEIAKAANSGGETTEGDKKTQRTDLLNSSASPAQFAAIGATKATLLSSKAGELAATYRKNMGSINPNFKPLSDTAVQTQKDLVALHDASKADPELKGQQAQQIVQRLRDAVALPDEAYTPLANQRQAASAPPSLQQLIAEKQRRTAK